MMKMLWELARLLARENFKEENDYSWDMADYYWEEEIDKYEREDRVYSMYEKLIKDTDNLRTKNLTLINCEWYMRNPKERKFCKVTTENNNTILNKKENKTMMNRTNAKERRMETLKANGVNTNNFFNLSMQVPVGANLQILIDGVPYTINSSNDEIVKGILDAGYVYNPKTDGRFVAAQTFKMLNEKSYNYKTRQYEEGWDAYLRNRFGYMYMFDMMVDELHRLSKMEKSNDPDFYKVNRFFTKDVVYQTCNHYVRQLRKFIKNQPTRKCKGEPYVKLNRYGNVFVKDLNGKVYNKLIYALCVINDSKTYAGLEDALKYFMSLMAKLPYDTPKCSVFKDAFKGKGAFMTLMNICKHHGVVVQNYETGEILDRDDSIKYVESLLDTYNGQYWKYHELLKATIELNKFDLKESIERNNRNEKDRK